VSGNGLENRQAPDVPTVQHQSWTNHVGKTQITILGLIRPDQDRQAVRYRGYMIMTYRVKLMVHMTLNGIRPYQVLSNDMVNYI